MRMEGMGMGMGPGMKVDFGGPKNSENRPTATFKDVKLSRILGLFQPYIKQLIVILALALTAAVIGLAPPWIMMQIIDKAIPGGNKNLLVKMIGLMVSVPLVNGLLGILQNHLNNKVGQGVMRDLRHSLFDNLQKQSMSFFTDTRSGEVIQRLTGDVQAVQGVVTGTIVQAITQVVVLITTCAIMFGMDWKLSLLALVILPLFVLPVRRVAKTRKKLRYETQRVRGEMASQLGEMFGVSGAMLTRIFGREQMQEEKFSEVNEKVMALEVRLNLIGRWYGMAIGLLGPLGTAIIYLYGGFSTIDGGAMTIGGIVAFSAYVGRLYGPITSLLNLHVEVSTALGIFQRIYDYLDRVPEIQDAPDAVDLPDVKGSIAYKDVSYAYQPDRYAVKDVSFKVHPGQLVALVGPSGAGKSTLIGLMARLYDPTKGSVEVDGLDLRKITMTSLRKQIAYVTQESFLFHASIRENLMFANSDATDEQLHDAVKKAYLAEMIASLPDGLDTIVGERGHRLSGGERQRLAIARAILRDPQILILDEATSSLDSESEAYVQAALEELMQGRTTLVIAHRLSTVLAADMILAVEGGRVVEAGSHSELLNGDGLYSRLYHTQFARVVS